MTASICMRRACARACMCACVRVCVCVGVFFPAAAHTDAVDGVIGCTCHSHSICCSELHSATGLPNTPSEIKRQNMEKYGISNDGEHIKT